MTDPLDTMTYSERLKYFTEQYDAPKPAYVPKPRKPPSGWGAAALILCTIAAVVGYAIANAIGVVPLLLLCILFQVAYGPSGCR
jgi:fatty acid desaturase